MTTKGKKGEQRRKSREHNGQLLFVLHNHLFVLHNHHQQHTDKNKQHNLHDHGRALTMTMLKRMHLTRKIKEDGLIADIEEGLWGVFVGFIHAR